MYKTNDECLKKAYDDEPIFVLMARDPNAPATILHWAGLSLNSQPREKIQEAINWAIKMNETRETIQHNIGLDKQIANLEKEKQQRVDYQKPMTSGPYDEEYHGREEYPPMPAKKKGKQKGIETDRVLEITRHDLLDLADEIRLKPAYTTDHLVSMFIDKHEF